MSCFLCGHEKNGSHHLGCLRISQPGLTRKVAEEMGLLPATKTEVAPEPKVEVLKEGSMTTVPADNTCEHDGCDNPKYSDHPRVKYCEEHKDPKNRKE